VNDPPPPARPTRPDAVATDAGRVTLTPTTMTALRVLARAWRLTRAEGAALIGVSASTWGRFQAGTWSGKLSQDQLLRVSMMIDMYRGLHLLFDGAMADRWPRRRNGGPPFAHMTPIGLMTVRGTAGIIEVRRYVEEMRQAHSG
jgi:hypothetical protein